MPASTRKAADAAPGADEAATEPAEVAGSAASVAEETPAVEPPAAEAFRPAVTVSFTGQAESSVAGVGLCVPGEQYTVPATLADALCRGDAPPFARVEAA